MSTCFFCCYSLSMLPFSQFYTIPTFFHAHNFNRKSIRTFFCCYYNSRLTTDFFVLFICYNTTLFCLDFLFCLIWWFFVCAAFFASYCLPAVFFVCSPREAYEQCLHFFQSKEFFFIRSSIHCVNLIFFWALPQFNMSLFYVSKFFLNGCCRDKKTQQAFKLFIHTIYHLHLFMWTL